MWIPKTLKQWLINKAFDRIEVTNGKPDFVIDPEGNGDVYLNRWYVIPRRRFLPRIYLHEFVRSDQDFALHDHPFLFNISILLQGGYDEEVFEDEAWSLPLDTKFVPVDEGAVKFRWGRSPHRVQLRKDAEGNLMHVWTIFITGPALWTWGFYCPSGWKPFDKVINHKPGVGSSRISSCD